MVFNIHAVLIIYTYKSYSIEDGDWLSVPNWTNTYLHEGRLRYAHDDSETLQDSLEFVARPVSGLGPRFTGLLVFAIDPRNDHSPLPVLTIGASPADQQHSRRNTSLTNNNNRSNNAVLRVAVGGARALGEELVRHADADSDQDDGKLLFSVRELPCGLLVRAVSIATQTEYQLRSSEPEASKEIDRFLQMDLVARHVLFVHRGPLTCHMRYTVNDSLHVTPGYAGTVILFSKRVSVSDS